MSADDLPPPRLFDRLLAALVNPSGGADAAFTLLEHRPPAAVVEVAGEGTGVVLLDRGEAPGDDLRASLDGIIQSHRGGLLFVVLVGGGAEARAALAEADRHAPRPSHLGVYHLDRDGRMSWVAGRRLRILQKAARGLAVVQPLDAAEFHAIALRSERDRDEAASFAASLQKRPARATIVLGSVCVALYMLTMLWGRGDAAYKGDGNLPPLIEAQVRMGANSAALVVAGQWWRLVSHAFLHANVPHLLFNMLALVSFGSFLEALIGWRCYLIVFTVSALSGGLASALIAENPLSVGASGAIWGLMAAGFGMVLRPGGPLPRLVAQRLRQRLLGVLAINGALSFLPGIDLWAHLGGGLAGFALAMGGLCGRRHEQAPEPRAVAIGAYVSAAVLVVALALAFAIGQPWQTGPS